jgi:DNA-binding SARP family transcriptional activator
MLRLETFGGLVLRDEAVVVATVQRRRLGMLAVLAAAGGRGVRREKLAGCLWSESSEEQARHALEQLLYSTRQQIAVDLFLGVNPLFLDPAVIGSDVGDFEGALSRGALAEAIALHRGPFLDGFYLDGAAAFERWTEGERTRLSIEYSRALHRLAKLAGTEGHYTLETELWQQLSSVDPLNERAAFGLARALVNAGDWAGALQHADAFDALVRQELDTPPTPAMAAFVEDLRRRHAGNVQQPAAAELRPVAERYRVDRELGRGTMATVYLAHDLKHDRAVALKVLRPALAASTEAARFLREIVIVARLHHPHILHLYDSGVLQQRGMPTPYYVMPFVRGESLRELIGSARQLPLEMALRTTRQVASAMGAAHEQGVIHRDLKPGNILLEAGQAMVADFGIAHALDLAGGEKLSRSGVVLGTPGYMSPEQAAGARGLEPRSDVYSLACVLYEMLAGAPPFTGATPQIILARQATDPVPSIRTVCPTISDALEAAIMQGLARTPGDRFPTMGEFADALVSE